MMWAGNVLCAVLSLVNSDAARTVQKECAGEEICFFVSTDFQSKVPERPSL